MHDEGSSIALFDTVSGRILHTQCIPGISTAAHATVVNNEVLVAFWDQQLFRSHGIRMDLYDHSHPVPSTMELFIGVPYSVLHLTCDSGPLCYLPYVQNYAFPQWSWDASHCWWRRQTVWRWRAHVTLRETTTHARVIFPIHAGQPQNAMLIFWSVPWTYVFSPLDFLLASFRQSTCSDSLHVNVRHIGFVRRVKSRHFFGKLTPVLAVTPDVEALEHRILVYVRPGRDRLDPLGPPNPPENLPVPLLQATDGVAVAGAALGSPSAPAPLRAEARSLQLVPT